MSARSSSVPGALTHPRLTPVIQWSSIPHLPRSSLLLLRSSYPRPCSGQAQEASKLRRCHSQTIVQVSSHTHRGRAVHGCWEASLLRVLLDQKMLCRRLNGVLLSTHCVKGRGELQCCVCVAQPSAVVHLASKALWRPAASVPDDVRLIARVPCVLSTSTCACLTTCTHISVITHCSSLCKPTGPHGHMHPQDKESISMPTCRACEGSHAFLIGKPAACFHIYEPP